MAAVASSANAMPLPPGKGVATSKLASPHNTRQNSNARNNKQNKQLTMEEIAKGARDMLEYITGREYDHPPDRALVSFIQSIEQFARHFSESPPQPPRELVIFADSQAAIQAVQNPKRPSGQHVLHAIYTHIRALTPGLSVTIRWIPAHMGVSGNELADAAAKEAAKGVTGVGRAMGSEISSSEAGASPKLRLATNAKRQIRARIRVEWAKQWTKEKTGRPNQRLIAVPHKRVLKLFEGLSKPYTSILVQMRSMRIGLRHFLYKINEAESDRCNCEEGSQTPRHVLLQCPRYIDLRKVFMEKVKRTDLDRGKLTDYEAIMSHSQAARYVAEFMLSTGLLGQFRHCDVEPEPELEPEPDEETEPTHRN